LGGPFIFPRGKGLEPKRLEPPRKGGKERDVPGQGTEKKKTTLRVFDREKEPTAIADGGMTQRGSFEGRRTKRKKEETGQGRRRHDVKGCAGNSRLSLKKENDRLAIAPRKP